MSKPTIIGKAILHNMDCMELLANTPDKFYELAIVDPPYGIGLSTNPVRQAFEKKLWDCAIPTAYYFSELKRVSKNQIIWGGNYFLDYLPATKGFIFWYKHQNGTFADGELAWCSFGKGRFYDRAYQLDIGGKTHPTQKPVKLYEWLLTNYAKSGDKILDTHLGSGSHAIACNNLGFELTACELDKDYFDASVKRVTQATAQARMFA